MKIKNLEFKLGNISFESLRDDNKIDSYKDVMYGYWGFNILIHPLTKHYDEIKSAYFSSGDFGDRILTFVDELEGLINQNITKYEPMYSSEKVKCWCKVSEICSMLDENTGDTGFDIQKSIFDYGDRGYTAYKLLIKNPNGESIVLDNLEENDIVKIKNKFKKWIDKGIRKHNKQLLED